VSKYITRSARASRRPVRVSQVGGARAPTLILSSGRLPGAELEGGSFDPEFSPPNQCTLFSKRRPTAKKAPLPASCRPTGARKSDINFLHPVTKRYTAARKNPSQPCHSDGPDGPAPGAVKSATCLFVQALPIIQAARTVLPHTAIRLSTGETGLANRATARPRTSVRKFIPRSRADDCADGTRTAASKATPLVNEVSAVIAGEGRRSSLWPRKRPGGPPMPAPRLRQADGQGWRAPVPPCPPAANRLADVSTC